MPKFSRYDCTPPTVLPKSPKQDGDQIQNNELILGILRGNSNGSMQPRLRDLSEMDWAAIVRQSSRHCIAPLFCHRLTTNFREVCLPERVLRCLKDVYLHITARNIRFYHALDQLLKGIGGSVPVLLLKGAHLAAFIYPNIGLRSMADMDILIHKIDLPAVARALRELGYIRSMEEPDHPFHVSYSDPTRTVSIEIHWNICPETGPPNSFNIEDLWTDARSEVFKENEIKVLRPEHLLLHICLHDAVQHSYYFGLKTLCDVDAIIRHYCEEIDWDKMVSHARRWEITKSCYLTLLLARELMDTDVPEKALTDLKPSDFSSQNLCWARKAILAPFSKDEPISGSFAEFWGADRYMNKMTILFKSIFPPREAISRMYSVPSSTPRILLYYACRLIKFCLRYDRSFREIWSRGSEVHTGLEAEHSRVLLREWLKT